MTQIKPLEELYDLKNDAHEFRNLAGDPEHQETLISMRKLMEKWLGKLVIPDSIRRKRKMP